MVQSSVLSYLRMRLTIVFLRIYTRWIAIKLRQRDEKLAQVVYSMQRKRIFIPSRNSGRVIKADLYLPPNSRSRDKAQVRPVLVNYHGSGFVLTGLLGSNVLYCARIACELGIAVLDADYRKAPEHPFPAAINDVEDVLRWISVADAQNTDYLFDSKRVMLSGFSSGGSLALAAASVLRSETDPPIDADIRAVVGIYPSTDLVTPPEDKKPPKEGIGTESPEIMRMFLDCYVPDEKQRADPRASPLLARADLYPQNVAIFTCEGDSLAAEGVSLAKGLRDSSRCVVSEMMLDVPHGFDAGAEEGSIAWQRRAEMYTMTCKAIGRAVKKSSCE
ncbi:unnamed protein product [Discula destructiva]